MTGPLSRSTILAGERLDYAIAYSPAAKRARIRVNPAGVVVVLPKTALAGRAEEFLQANAGWVSSQMNFFERAQSIRLPPRHGTGRTLVIRGRPCIIRVVRQDTNRQCGVVQHEGDTVLVRVAVRGGIDPDRTLLAWLRRQAKADIMERLAVRSLEMKRRPGKVFIMAQRTKWGNCSSRGNVSINWRLVMAPPEVLDYIVVHELAHLIEPYHSPKFWFVVASHCPQYQRHRQWLSDNGIRLFTPFNGPR